MQLTKCGLWWWLTTACLCLMSCKPEPVDETQLVSRLSYHAIALERSQRATQEEQWRAFSAGVTPKFEAVPGSSLGFFDYPKLAEFRGRVTTPELARHLELVYRRSLEAQIVNDARITRFVTGLAARDARRPRQLEDTELSDAQLEWIVRHDPEPERREQAWRVRYLVDSDYAADLQDLFRLRTKRARSLGFENYYNLALDADGLEQSVVETLIAELAQRTLEPARMSTDQLSNGQKRVKPWNVEHTLSPYLTQVEPRLDAANLLLRIQATLTALGLPVNQTAIQISAQAQPDRSQRFLAFPVEPPHDVRILLTPADGFYAYRASFHEFGHALYYANATQEQYLDRLPPNRVFSEAIGKIFERLPYQSEWLASYAQLPPQLASGAAQYVRDDELFRIRHFLLGFYFEKEAYANPNQDLDKLYMRLATELGSVDYQGLPAAWASAPHLSTQPLANLQYLMARLIQAQVYEAFEKDHGAIIDNPRFGAFCREELFQPGSHMSWLQLVEKATGSELTINAYLRRELRMAAGKH